MIEYKYLISWITSTKHSWSSMITMAEYKYLLGWVTLIDYLWLATNTCNQVRAPVAKYKYLWPSLNIFLVEYLWLSMNTCDRVRVRVAEYEYLIGWVTLAKHLWSSTSTYNSVQAILAKHTSLGHVDQSWLSKAANLIQVD